MTCEHCESKHNAMLMARDNAEAFKTERDELAEVLKRSRQEWSEAMDRLATERLAVIAERDALKALANRYRDGAAAEFEYLRRLELDNGRLRAELAQAKVKP